MREQVNKLMFHQEDVDRQKPCLKKKDSGRIWHQRKMANIVFSNT